jgi:hypothetical protein
MEFPRKHNDNGVMEPLKWMNWTYVLQAFYSLNMWNQSKYVKSWSRCLNITSWILPQYWHLLIMTHNTVFGNDLGNFWNNTDRN